VKRYTDREKTKLEHAWEIQREYGLTPFAEVEPELMAWIADQAWMTEINAGINDDPGAGRRRSPMAFLQFGQGRRGRRAGFGCDHFKSDVRRTPTHVLAKESK